MAFLDFSRNCLDISTSFVSSFPVWPVIFGLILIEVLLLLLWKSIIPPATFKAGLSL